MSDPHSQREHNQDPAAPSLEVRRVEFRSPAIWLAVAPEQWSTICWLATRYGWTLPRPASNRSTSECTFQVRGESAVELFIVLERIRKNYTDRELRAQYFGQRGWKAKLDSLVSFFASGGVAIFVCRLVGQFKDADTSEGTSSEVGD